MKMENFDFEKKAVENVQFDKALFTLEGKIAIVTGAGRGMGESIAYGLANMGATVIATDIDDKSAVQTAQNILEKGGKAEGAKMDISDEAQVEQFMDDIVARYGKLDILVNNAAILDVGSRSFPEMTVEGFRRTIGVNLTGVYICSRYAAIHMCKQNSGSIINIGSNSSRGAVLNMAWGSPAYAASKAAVHCLTRSMAQNVAKYGVRINCVAPAAVDTPMHAHHRDWLVDTYNNLVPLGRVMVAEDVVGTVCYLATDAAAFVTGQSIHVNGGILMVD